MPDSAARRRAIRRILSSNPVRSQSDLAQALSKDGFETTQATVSRDLRDLGAVKVPDPEGGARYAIPDRDHETGGERVLGKTLGEFALTITSTGNLVVIKTPPGAAQVVAGAVDHAALEDVIGTVAGDDTLFIAVAERTGGSKLAVILESIGGTA